jgi:hypothetical protein
MRNCRIHAGAQNAIKTGAVGADPTRPLAEFDLENKKAPGCPVPCENHLLWMVQILLRLSGVFLGSSRAEPVARW